MTEKKKKVKVRRHKRRLKSGNATIVKKHYRSKSATLKSPIISFTLTPFIDSFSPFIDSFKYDSNSLQQAILTYITDMEEMIDDFDNEEKEAVQENLKILESINERINERIELHSELGRQKHILYKQEDWLADEILSLEVQIKKTNKKINRIENALEFNELVLNSKLSDDKNAIIQVIDYFLPYNKEKLEDIIIIDSKNVKTKAQFLQNKDQKDLQESIIETSRELEKLRFKLLI